MKLSAVVVLLAGTTLACSSRTARTSPEASTVIAGRWVAENIPMAYHFFGDSAEIVMYPAPAPAPPTWRVRGDSVVVTEGGRATSHWFAIRGDSLYIDWYPGPRRPGMGRLQPRVSSGLEGSWRLKSAGDLMIVTFRSDGALIGEIGAAPWPVVRGDTLLIRVGQGTAKQLVRRVDGSLRVEQLNAPGAAPLKLIRRPWGCFGVSAIDGNARECR